MAVSNHGREDSTSFRHSEFNKYHVSVIIEHGLHHDNHLSLLLRLSELVYICMQKETFQFRFRQVFLLHSSRAGFFKDIFRIFMRGSARYNMEEKTFRQTYQLWLLKDCKCQDRVINTPNGISLPAYHLHKRHHKISLTVHGKVPGVWRSFSAFEHIVNGAG